LGGLREALRSGERPLLEHVESVLATVAEREPRVRALLPEPGRRERLLDEASALLARFPDPDGRPPLFGALVGVKDIFSVDGLPTRAGSALPPEAFEGPEAVCVARLRAAGALVLGKTVTTEFAYVSPGATTNPHDATRTPGGSSSGSAAAVACGYAELALGSQTVGSIIRPAAFCGVIGYKPTYGRIPLDGMLLFSKSVDCAGVLAADLETAELAAAAMVDGGSSPSSPHGPPVIGVPEGPLLERAEDRARADFARQIAALEKGGLQVRHVPALEDFEEITRRHYALIVAEFAREHARLFERWGALYSGQSAATYDSGLELGEAAISEGRESSARVRAQLAALMDESGIDLWASPAATGPAPPGLLSTGDAILNMVWTHAHMPAVTIPAGRIDALPLGLQLSARAGDDEPLLAWAKACAAAFRSDPPGSGP
jgi:Asp-tRNA(Asn)/Glu-tRNA(Gln) amidotransferase A subunit family amidase